MMGNLFAGLVILGLVCCGVAYLHANIEWKKKSKGDDK